MRAVDIATSTTSVRDSRRAAVEAYEALVARLAGPPSLLIVFPTVGHDIPVVAAALRELAGDVPMHGATTCQGVMSEAGFVGDAGLGLGLLGIRDDDGDYGVAARTIGDDPRGAGRAVIAAAIAAAGRDGEPPALVWLAADPGFEEAVIAGIQDVLGPDVPIAGGSAADNDVAGHWQEIANGDALRGAVVVTAMYPSGSIHVAFHSGYSPSDRSGVATRVDGRTLHEIDGRPAAEVYDEWTGGVIADVLGRGGNVLRSTTLHPLGRVAGEYGGLPFHRLSHPDSVTAEGALTLFTEIDEGERLIQMVGTRESLVSRAGRVARAAMRAGNLEASDLAGALVVYCAGCMLTIQSEIGDVAGEVARELGGKPFLGTFTFGEQGCFVNRRSHHGNLMISVVVFRHDER
nr:FIST N-terminal domain-containing protein [Nannocystis pusilla]